MRPIYYTLLLFGIVWTSFSYTYAQPFVPATDVTAIRKKIAAASQTTAAIKSDFVQEKNLSMISEKVISKGLFYFKKDNRVRLEYIKPFNYLMIINNGKILIKDDEKSTQIDMHRNKVFQEVNNIIINCVQGTVFSGTDFNIAVFENAAQIKLEMLPTTKGLKEFFQSIFVFIDKKDYSAIRIEMNEISGDNTIISFTNKEINGKVDDTLFAVK